MNLNAQLFVRPLIVAPLLFSHELLGNLFPYDLLILLCYQQRICSSDLLLLFNKSLLFLFNLLIRLFVLLNLIEHTSELDQFYGLIFVANRSHAERCAAAWQLSFELLFDRRLIDTNAHNRISSIVEWYVMVRSLHHNFWSRWLFFSWRRCVCHEHFYRHCWAWCSLRESAKLWAWAF